MLPAPSSRDEQNVALKEDVCRSSKVDGLEVCVGDGEKRLHTAAAAKTRRNTTNSVEIGHAQSYKHKRKQKSLAFGSSSRN